MMTMQIRLTACACLTLFAAFVIGCGSINTGTSPENTAILDDTDNDGIPDISDDDIDGDGLDNQNDPDMDGDLIKNDEDPDMDGDGIDNIDDNDIDGDGIPNEQDFDIDGDGILNSEDDDIDGDGIKNIDDNDIDGDGIPNEEDSDLDGDGIKNDIDDDLDGDGIPNAEDIDIDGDGIPNDQDDDIDNDGILNEEDDTPGGTGTQTDGSQGETNPGEDRNEGETNTGDDQNSGNTDDDHYEEGIAAVSVDTIEYTFEIGGGSSGNTADNRKVIDLQDIRNTIKDNGIALSTFSITDLKLFAAPESDAFATVNEDCRLAMTISYISESGTNVPIIYTLDTEGGAGPVITAGDLKDGLELNEEIFGSYPGLSEFKQMIKDETMQSLTTVATLTLLDDVTLPVSELNMILVIKTSGKKAL